MKQRFLWGMLWMFLLIVFVAINEHTFAEQILYVNNTLVNVRSAPTAADKNVVRTIPRETPVEILSQQGSWYHVRLPDGSEGWVSERVLVSRGSAGESRGNILPPETIPENIPEHATPSASAGGVSSVLALDDDMVFIQGGTAIIGSDEREIRAILRMEGASQDMFADEMPKEQINIQGFYIDRYEVTNAQYKQFVEATRYPPPLNWENGTYPLGSSKHPVTFISWDDAHAYARWAGKRLPTAEEWEISSRGGNGRIFPWGETFDVQHININHTQNGPAPVGSHPDDVSSYNVYDLGGNVMEWTLTQYEGNKDFFVLKGGSWAGKPFEARGANKVPGEAIYQLSHIGFRCAKSVAE